MNRRGSLARTTIPTDTTLKSSSQLYLRNINTLRSSHLPVATFYCLFSKFPVAYSQKKKLRNSKTRTRSTDKCGSVSFFDYIRTLEVKKELMISD